MSETSLSQVGGKSTAGIDGATLAFWSDLTVSGSDGGQKVLALNDSWEEKWPMFGPFKPDSGVGTDKGPVRDGHTAGAQPAAGPALPGAPEKETQPAQVGGLVIDDAEAQAMLAFAVGLAGSAPAAEPDAATEPPCTPAAPAAQATAEEATGPEPGSDAAHAMAFDAALQAALAADARDMLAEGNFAELNPAIDGAQV
jgi:hypothetical protein